MTKDWRLTNQTCTTAKQAKEFPINRRHQGLVTHISLRHGKALHQKTFLFNRRHQGLATRQIWRTSRAGIFGSFQSIGVTKDWRRAATKASGACIGSFQSIGVTKDWRPRVWDGVGSLWVLFPINRCHQRVVSLILFL